METVKVNGKLMQEERETILHYDLSAKQWILDSTVPKHFHKAEKQGWTPVRQYVYSDGTVCGMVLTAPERAITIRNAEKKQMTDNQLTNLA
jgi:hypothetical protein